MNTRDRGEQHVSRLHLEFFVDGCATTRDVRYSRFTLASLYVLRSKDENFYSRDSEFSTVLIVLCSGLDHYDSVPHF